MARLYRQPWRIYRQELKMGQMEAHAFLEAKFDDFAKFVEEYERLSKSFYSPMGSMYPDMVAKKGSEYYFVEVKVNRAELKELQREILQMAQKYGFKTKVVRARIKVECREEPVT